MDSIGISVIQRAKPFLMDNLEVDETFLDIFWSNELLTSPDVYRILRAVCTTCGGLRNYRMKYIRWFTGIYMMTTWQRDDVRITGPLWGLSTSHQWITLTKCRKRGTLIFVSCFSLKKLLSNEVYRRRFDKSCDVVVMICPSHYDDVIMTTLASQMTSLTVVYSIVYSGVNQRKHQSSASLAFVMGIHRDRWIPRTKGQ